MNFNKIHRVYFLGIGGIGMSALARYFVSEGKQVAGYDRTETPLTKELENQGIPLNYNDEIAQIPEIYLQKENTLIVLTPAIPKKHNQWNFFKENQYYISKRAEVLGLIFNPKFGIAIAGTHGKTTISSMTSFLLKETGIDCSAFLGGIAKNYGTNLLIGSSEVIVAEADEFDRSFLQLKPNITVVTAMDADHLDIYSDIEDINQTFNKFVRQLKPGGILIHKFGLQLLVAKDNEQYTYSLDNKAADFYAFNIQCIDGIYNYSIHTPFGDIDNLSLKHPGIINLENSIAALAVGVLINKDEKHNLVKIQEFNGIQRRFEILFQNKDTVYIDDYAHHPKELDATISSARKMFPARKITGVFQPHLFSRTRDFLDEFAESLSSLDELVLLDIYPARELPIEGINSELLLKKVNIKKKHYCSKENLIFKLKGLNIEVLLTLGAGDIDQLTLPMVNMLKNK